MIHPAELIRRHSSLWNGRRQVAGGRTHKAESELCRVSEASAEVVAGCVHVHARNIGCRQGLQLRARAVVELPHALLELAQWITLLCCNLLPHNLQGCLQVFWNRHNLHTSSPSQSMRNSSTIQRSIHSSDPTSANQAGVILENKKYDRCDTQGHAEEPTSLVNSL